jgi:glycerol-3-phosphate cytidylyltransferase-like family protein
MPEKDRIIATCGCFDPLSLEELNFLKRCKSRGDWLAVGIHSDWWMNWSQGGFVHNYETRREIIKSLKFVDEIFTFNDMDGTICQFLKLLKICYPDAIITYASTDDMFNTPETKIRGITFETLK